MALPKPEPGLVIRYSYLWHEEFLAGRDEGVKDRPCAIIAAIRDDDGEQRVLVLPVTHHKPANMELAMEIPVAVKKHLKLDAEHSWVILSESNEFLWPGPDLRRIREGSDSTVAYGFLPPKLFTKLRQKFLTLNTAHVRRTE